MAGIWPFEMKALGSEGVALGTVATARNGYLVSISAA